MKAFLVERMNQSPNTCMKCGRGNTPDGVDGTIGPFVDLGIDYNYGDSGYLCVPCIEEVAALVGWISPDTAKDQRREIKKLEKEIHNLEADLEKRRQRERKALRAARAHA